MAKRSTEFERGGMPGLPVLIAAILLLLSFIGTLGLGISGALEDAGVPGLLTALYLGASITLPCFMFAGLLTLQPNEGAVLILFGEYKGTVKKSGFYFVNPLYIRKKISLRSRNLNGDKLKVNDLSGNPIEIAAVVVWKVDNTFEATFDVDDYTRYVEIHSESCVRHIAGKFPYDVEGSGNISLRGSSDEIAGELKAELQAKLSKAGVVVEEARISHLAYAPEIASSMLKRQQADAIIAARTKIVDGAVGMVEMAIRKLEENGVVDLDQSKKADMVCNLMVVLCGEKDAQPVVNTGSSL